MEMKKAVSSNSVGKMTALAFVMSLLVFVICSVAVLHHFATDFRSQALLSTAVLGWFTIAWSQISELNEKYVSLRKTGTFVTIASLFFSSVLIWFKPVETASLWLQVALVCFILSYMCVHYAYFINARPYAHTILRCLEVTAILCITVVGILSMLFVLHDGNIPSEFFYRMLTVFMILSAVATIMFSIIKRKSIVIVPCDGPPIA